MSAPVNPCECGDHAWQAMGNGRVVLVTAKHAPLLSMWNWHAWKNNGNFYARRTSTRKNSGRQCNLFLLLHRVICPCVGAYIVDHDNGNSLDNRESNLKPVLPMINSHRQRKSYLATSSYRCVSLYHGRWRVTLQHKNKTIYVGCFVSEVEAAKAYDVVAAKTYGIDAVLNFPFVTEAAQ